MPDNLVIPFLIGFSVTGWALACGFMLDRNKWHSRYLASRAGYRNLLIDIQRPLAKTPHQKAAETRRQRELERKRKHRLAMQADVERRKLAGEA
jgi:hypothetical protein